MFNLEVNVKILDQGFLKDFEDFVVKFYFLKLLGFLGEKEIVIFSYKFCQFF